MSNKLPEWPEAPFTNSMAPSYTKDWADYHRAKADAALARMEALAEYVEHYDSWTHGCATLGATSKAWTEGKRGCTCGLSELLAACDRP